MELEKVDSILERHNREPSSIIAMLQDIQAEANYLPGHALRYVAENLDIPLSKIYGLATFYRTFSLQPRGRHLIYVCLGTACHVRGGVKIKERIERDLNIKAGETTPDLMFTLETVNCVGACALGPVVIIDDQYHGQMTQPKVASLLKKYAKSREDEKADS